MALTPSPPVSDPKFLQISVKSPSPLIHYLLFGSRKRFGVPLLPAVVRPPSFKKFECFARSSSTEEDRLSEAEKLAVSSAGDGNDDDGVREDPKVKQHQISLVAAQRIASSPRDPFVLGIREPVYEVVEVKSNGNLSTRKISRRKLLKSSGLRPRDIRSVDPSLFLTKSVPALLVRELAILLNLGSLRAIAMKECVLIFDYNSEGGKAFIDTLLPRLNNMNGAQSMPFELEVVEAALLSRIQRLEQKLMDLEPRVQAILKVLPNKITGDILEQLRISKQTLAELSSKAGALRQMLLDLLEDPDEIHQICIMGRNCTIKRGNDDVECLLSEEVIAEEEVEEIEMLLEYYLQRCESCHGQAERLLDSAKEMEDSIAVNLSSRRLEVGRVELLLQVAAFCIGVGALVSGIFGMNLRSYLEEHVFAFWLATGGIIFGAVLAFFLMYAYLRSRKILNIFPSLASTASPVILFRDRIEYCIGMRKFHLIHPVCRKFAKALKRKEGELKVGPSQREFLSTKRFECPQETIQVLDVVGRASHPRSTCLLTIVQHLLGIVSQRWCGEESSSSIPALSSLFCSPCGCLHVVASMDWPEITKWNCRCKPHPEEIIQVQDVYKTTQHPENGLSSWW
ncbi:hypothetical protein V6N13_000836 [Hibiscus sabdariffa]